MVLRKLSQTLQVTLAFMVATFSSGLLAPAASVGALSTSTNNSCPAGTLFLEKYDWEDDSYVLDGDSDGSTVTVTGDETGGTFNVSSGYEVTDVIVKGGPGSKTDHYTDGVPSGTFTKIGLPLVGNGNTPDISHLEFCGTATLTGTLGVETDCEQITLSSSAVTPAGATIIYEIDDVAAVEGANPVTEGSHKIELIVNGEVVDSKTVSVDACVDEVPPEGTLSVDVDCEEGTFSGTVTAPADGVATFTVNGIPTAAGHYTNVAPGEYTVQMFVNGTLVDSETVTVTECEEPPFECPQGTEWVDINDDQTKTADECFAPTEGICHATGNENNDKYVRIANISPAGIYHGHLDDDFGGAHVDHQNGEDIIPPFTYQGHEYSQNWPSGQAIFDNDCVVPEQQPQANVTATVICTATGVKVTLTNSGDADGSATVNGEVVNVPANDSKDVLVSFDLGTPFKATVAVTIGESSLFNGVVSCGNVLGETDICPNITGSQATIPVGMTKNSAGDCVAIGGMGGGQTLGTSTELPAALPSTGGEQNPMLILLASLMAYGIAYLFQGRRQLNQTRA